LSQENHMNSLNNRRFYVWSYLLPLITLSLLWCFRALLLL